MQIGAATVENSMEFPQKTKNGTALWPSNSAGWDYTQRTLKTTIQKNNKNIFLKFWKLSCQKDIMEAFSYTGKYPSKKLLSSGKKQQATTVFLCPLQITSLSLSTGWGGGLQLTGPDK